MSWRLCSYFNGRQSFSISCKKDPLKVSASNNPSLIRQQLLHRCHHQRIQWVFLRQLSRQGTHPIPPSPYNQLGGCESEYLQIEMNHSISTMSGKTKLKVIFLGNQSVGKTCIIDKYINDRFEETANPTVGIDFLAKNVIHNAKSYRLQLWDTAGQERFRSLIPGYLKDAHCALIVYDVTAKSSFADIQSWIKLYNENKVGEGFIFMIGNKIDREFREVTQEEGLEKANRLGLPYFQISAKTGINIEQLFAAIIEQQTEKKITSSRFLPEKQSMKPVEMVKEEKEEQEKPSNVEDTGAKVVNEPAQAAAENIVLKNEKKPEARPKKADCC